ncbi:MAG TPA: hypothetical protein VMV14_09620 [Acidimicrobiales bacterium]|nr:hypothetical protein [Acidimicrobiales bacterium]
MPSPRPVRHLAASSRWAAAALVVAVGLAACGGPAARSGAHHGARSGVTTTSAAGASAAGGANGSHGGTGSTTAGSSGSSHPGGATSGTTIAGQSTTGTTAPPARTASQAVSEYVQAIVGDNGAEMGAVADKQALALGGVILDYLVIDKEQGGTPTVTSNQSTLAPSAGTGTSTVTFSGSVTLTTTVSGSSAPGTYSYSLSGPLTVVDENGAWRVTNLQYDNASVQEWPESASGEVNGLYVQVGFVLSYGTTTTALITMALRSGNASVQLQNCTLTAGGSGANGVSDFTGPPQPTGLLRFPRIKASPTSLALHFTSSTGQNDDFSLALS